MEKVTFEQLPEMMALLLEKVERLERLLVSGTEDGLLLKEMLTTDEAAVYLGISKSSLYKTMMRRAFPTYRPGGKKVYLKRSEIDAWMMSQRSSSQAEIEQEALDYVARHPLKLKR